MVVPRVSYIKYMFRSYSCEPMINFNARYDWKKEMLKDLDFSKFIYVGHIRLKIILLIILFGLFNQQLNAADLLYGNSKNDPSCVGTIQMTYPFAELVYNIKAIQHGGSSLNPDFSFIENVWPKVITQATYAAISNDERNYSLVYKQLLELAKHKTALATITRKASLQTPCYSKGTDQPCAFQAFKMAVNYFSYYSYSAFLIKSYIDSQPDSKIIYDYAREGYQKYILANIDPHSEGIFELLDGYIGMYSVSYTHLTLPTILLV